MDVISEVVYKYCEVNDVNILNCEIVKVRLSDSYSVNNMDDVYRLILNLKTMREIILLQLILIV